MEPEVFRPDVVVFRGVGFEQKVVGLKKAKRAFTWGSIHQLEAGASASRRYSLSICWSGHGVSAGDPWFIGSRQPSASSPFRSTMLSNFKEGPLGCFLPCSHFCTVDALAFR